MKVKKQLGQVKKNFELDILSLLKTGLNPSKIAVHLNISMPNLQYYLSSLKRQNVIKKVGYGTWEIIPSRELKILSHKGSLQVKNIRGHAFIWKIKPNKRFNWGKILERENIYSEPKGIVRTPRILLDGRKVWLGQNYITIYEKRGLSYFATNSIEAKKEGILEFLKLVEKIKGFTGDFKYKFTCKRQHYGHVNNPEALHFISKSQKILIKGEKGYWFSIDYSKNKYKEAETIHERDADIDSLGYQGLMNSHEKTNFKVTPEFVLNTMQGIQENQLIFDKNMKSHLDVLGKIGSAVAELREEVKNLREKK